MGLGKFWRHIIWKSLENFMKVETENLDGHLATAYFNIVNLLN